MAVNAAGNSEPSLCSPSYKIKEKIGTGSNTQYDSLFCMDLKQNEFIYNSILLSVVGSAPEFIKKPADTKAPLGGEVSFSAEVHGTPFPTCQWWGYLPVNVAVEIQMKVFVLPVLIIFDGYWKASELYPNCLLSNIWINIIFQNFLSIDT